ncbi:hypothetical protein FK535_03770 [Mycolicibacterium sp. 018/SC-01/001]|uniref:hypothetical protein n=1 Tax=Mycolicibacterium sp. 018/SC-01/001 TaxID=2592069 RepID=UPI00117BE420|nr:hypothetical protein [Mycolicibacterium sp. 018/SC-01/001]TRW88325.1 hypothetical protein FK535_03770 [Mycolicibacterium sp. 018/SC-01/001]
MIDEPAARDIALAKLPPEKAVLGAARELAAGWFFPCVMRDIDTLAGVIVNKDDGRPLHVMSDSPMANDLTLYDRGYQFHTYDLVVLATEDIEHTIRLVHDMGPLIVDTYYKFERVYRVRRPLTEDEIRERLQSLPAVFGGVSAYHLDRLEAAREAGWLTFKVFEYRPKD